MIYERPGQAEQKPESNLTWVRGREVDAKVKMKENYLLLETPADSRAYIHWNFKEKAKSPKKQGKCERTGISRTRERMR